MPVRLDTKTTVPVTALGFLLLLGLYFGFPLVKNLGAKEAENAAVVQELGAVNVSLQEMAKTQSESARATAAWQSRIETQVETINTNQQELMKRVRDIERNQGGER